MEEIPGDRRQGAPLGDEAIRVLLAERGAEVARLAGRVEQLMADRVSAERVAKLADDQHATATVAQKLEYAVFGATGNNGLLSSVKDLQKQVAAMREEELTDLKESIIESRRQIKNMLLAIIPAVAAIAGAFIAAGHV